MCTFDPVNPNSSSSRPTKCTSRYWSMQEDQQLLDLVKKYGPRSWIKISRKLGTRSPKQCHERYTQNLKPDLKHEEITPEEAKIIEKEVNGKTGRKWAVIARKLGGRSGNKVKNWWYTAGNGRCEKYRGRGKQEPRDRRMDVRFLTG